GSAYIDLASGRFFITEHQDEVGFLTFYQRVLPKEVLVAEAFPLLQHFTNKPQIHIRAKWDFERLSSEKVLCEHFQIQSLKSFDADEASLSISAAGCLMRYVYETQRTQIHHIQGLKLEREADSLHLDKHTLQNLEILTNLQGKKDHTLLSILDKTQTPMGSRMLQRWLTRPLRRKNVIDYRLSIIT